MVVVPVPTVVTTPVDASMVATDVLLLLQVPPVADDVNVEPEPRHKDVLPLMLPPVELTVTTAVAVQEPPIV